PPIFSSAARRRPRPTLFPYTTLFRSTATPELVELGERLYRAGNPDTGLPACMACHGPNGAGNPAAQYPRVAGQHAAYAAAQLRADRKSTRLNSSHVKISYAVFCLKKK